MIKLGFIGFGEAAYNISKGLLSEGLTGIIAYDVMVNQKPMCDLIYNRAKDSGVTILSNAGEVVKQADVVILSVPSSFAMDACRSIIEYLYPGQVCVDVGASAPETKKQEWELVKEKGVLFSDSAMLGSLPALKHKVPILASGNGADKFRELFTPYGMKIDVVGKIPGEASAIKLLRSIFMKGIAALMIEMLEGAEAYDVSEQVISSISSSLDNITFKEHLDRLVTGTAIHAQRRADELKGSIELLIDAGLKYYMTEAAKERHSMLQSYNFAERFYNRKPNGWQEIINIVMNERQDI